MNLSLEQLFPQTIRYTHSHSFRNDFVKLASLMVEMEKHQSFLAAYENRTGILEKQTQVMERQAQVMEQLVEALKFASIQEYNGSEVVQAKRNFETTVLQTTRETTVRDDSLDDSLDGENRGE